MFTAIVALGSSVWEADFVSALNHPSSDFQIVRRCVDGIDLRASAKIHEVDVILISDDTLRVDVALIAELKSSGAKIVALSADETFWADQGVSDCIVVDVSKMWQTMSQITDVMNEQFDAVQTDSSQLSQLIAVASFGGGVGRSLVTKELSYAFAKAEQSVALIEADIYGPTIQQELNLPSDAMHILECCSLLHRYVDDVDRVAEMVIERVPIPLPNLAVIRGIPRVAQWIDLRPDLLNQTYKKLQTIFDYCIVDVGPVMDPEAGVMSQSMYPSRQAASMMAIEQASSVILCVRADLVSVTRFIKHFLEVSEFFNHADVHVVLNEITHQKNVREFTQSIQRYTGISSVYVIENCTELVNAAAIKHTFLAELNASSQLVQQMSSIVQKHLRVNDYQRAEQKLTQLVQSHTQHFEVA